MSLKKGLIEIYTGCGKGKTTAALGLAIRANGAGLKTCIYQFIKGKSYSELKALKRLSGINVIQCGRGCFIKKQPAKKDIELARGGLERAEKIISSRKYDLVILDEINVALRLGLIDKKDLIRIIKEKPARVELILTGRYCPKSLYKHADLITDMREIKHPYQRGIKARRGIEF
ncbi:MAG: cob(I)yrinic acid a,c-diamide adenosyltransferase [Candidatus Omnitrophica bacterium]|nr:cob(I)yrinic acid a,c-diamide adenosyltransferase [Candidatus Omnitrophota bacterium]